MGRHTGDSDVLGGRMEWFRRADTTALPITDDTGQSASWYAGHATTPKILGGSFTHDSPGSGSASSYWMVNARAPVTRLGARFVLGKTIGTTTGGAVGVIVANEAIDPASGTLKFAVQVTISATNWRLQTFSAPNTFSTKASGTFERPLAIDATTAHEVEIHRTDATVVVVLPDGTVATTTDRQFSSSEGNWAVFANYAQAASTDNLTGIIEHWYDTGIPRTRQPNRGVTRRRALYAGLTATAALTATMFGRKLLTHPSDAAPRGSARLAPVFSTADYAQVSGDDRPRVVLAVRAAVAAMMSTGADQTVLIHAPMTFTTGTTKGALATTADPTNQAYGKQGVPLPVNLDPKLRIVFAQGAKITLSADCVNAFYIDKVADYDVFQNVDFYDAWIDGANLPATSHALIGNYLNYSAYVRYLSFQNVNFYGKTRFTNMFWDPTGAGGEGQTGIAFLGEHNGPLEATQTFSKNITLEDGEQFGGGGLFAVNSTASLRHRPGGCNHYYDNIRVGRYRYVNPSPQTVYANTTQTAIYICGAGFGDYAYIGPGYVENIGDDAIEVGTMQRMDIIEPRSRNSFYLGVLIRQTHAPIDVDNQQITIRGLNCEVTRAITDTAGAWGYPIRLVVDDQVITLTSPATGGTVTFTVPDMGTTDEIAYNASASTIAAAFVAIGCTGTVASGGPLGTSTVTVTIGNVNLSAPVTFMPSLTGGTLALDLGPSNASFGTVTIEDAVFTIDGLKFSKHGRTTGLFINGLDQPHRKVEIIRPKMVLSNYTYDSASSNDLSLYYPVAPYAGWGHLVLRDHDLTLAGTCNFQSLAGQGALFEVNAGGQETRVEIDGMTNDRAASLGGRLFQVVVGLVAGSEIRAEMRRLFPRTLAIGQTNGGTALFSTATVTQFDVFDSNFAQGTDASQALNLSSAGVNTTVVRAGRNTYPAAVVGAAINLTGSPFTWHNDFGTRALVRISGGTVSQLDYSPPSGSFTTLQFTSGTCTLEPGGSLKVSYSVAPTMSYDLIG